MIPRGAEGIYTINLVTVTMLAYSYEPELNAAYARVGYTCYIVTTLNPALQWYPALPWYYHCDATKIHSDCDYLLPALHGVQVHTSRVCLRQSYSTHVECTILSLIAAIALSTCIHGMVSIEAPP